ncbi:hypothetical protein ACFVZ3_39800 [Kitasatospora purpeofusca]|uniref:hypothetical protein n=1 Tax=Kitasatospora purpeofusca TaxID=67352 RepID=UPI003669820F
MRIGADRVHDDFDTEEYTYCRSVVIGAALHIAGADFDLHLLERGRGPDGAATK